MPTLNRGKSSHGVGSRGVSGVRQDSVNDVSGISVTRKMLLLTSFLS